MKRILKYVEILNKNVSIGAKRKPEALTVFIEPDDLLFSTFIYDDNFGFMADPAAKDPEFTVEHGERAIPIKIYMRNGWEEFLEFLKNNREKIEPVLFTKGQ